ncbi:MAG: hypothetical protein AB1650_00335 [Candidatus Omnitrophota bacterium]
MFNNFANKIWQFMMKRVARAHGIIDPVAFSAKLNRFGQPSEVIVPVELIRMSAVLHARGLVNSRAIQHNLDWVWPYWVVKQFDPKNISFIPRAFSLTHINLTERNWTAIGLPGIDEFPIVDPRGLVTPFFDSWSLDGWIVGGGHELLPSRSMDAVQQLVMDGNICLKTKTANTFGYQLEVEAQVISTEAGPVCHVSYKAKTPLEGASLVISVRPYNPEGVSFINSISMTHEGNGWIINKKHSVLFSAFAHRHVFSDYPSGDVYERLDNKENLTNIKCDVGMATAAAVFPLEPEQIFEISVDVPLLKRKDYQDSSRRTPIQHWHESLRDAARLSLSDKHFEFLYNAAVRTLVLMTGEDIYPGPYTYKHFWFRDAAFMLYALTMIGLTKRGRSAVNLFFQRQKLNGYFLSQDGEWDSNGQVLWSIRKFYEMTGERVPVERRERIKRGVRWIMHKRLGENMTPHSGLMPAGFSAEHFGPNDYYYWDDFWSVEGLRSGAFLLEQLGERYVARKCLKEAEALLKAIERSLEKTSQRLKTKAMPSSPYRRLDSASVGLLAASYPLKLWKADDERIDKTTEFLLENCFLKNSFFHDMSHSGINPYLTLHVAEVLLRKGDGRYYDLMKAVADSASPAGQWPEAIHPNTGGGCMGDGQHAWASAEWIMMLRNCFVQEGAGDILVLCPGVHPGWYSDNEASFGWLFTSRGKIYIRVRKDGGKVKISWEGRWHDDVPPNIIVKLPGLSPVQVPYGETSVEVS